MLNALPTHPTLLHPLTGQPLRAIGVRPDGAPLWPIMGASEESDDANDEDVEADEDDDSAEGDDSTPDGDNAGDDADKDTDALGDAGKKALDRMKAKLKEERAKRREAESKLNDDADDKATEAMARANARIVKSEVKAAAKGVLADPQDAYRFLDLDQFEVDDDGNVDEDDIADAIADLVKNKPYLAAQGGRRFQGDASGGTRKEARPKQLTRADLKGMSPSEIDKAHKAGQLKDLLKTN